MSGSGLAETSGRRLRTPEAPNNPPLKRSRSGLPIERQLSARGRCLERPVWKRSAVCFGSLCKSIHSDPIRPVSSLLSGRSAKSRLCELELYKAAVGDLTQSAMSSHWPPNPYSGHPGEAVCSPSTCHIGPSPQYASRPCSSAPLYSVLRVVSASKQ